MQDAKEEIRARINIEDVIGEYVQLKRAGRNFKGLSPFTGEKTPSFYVSPDKNIWHDFSSNKGGDVFSFVMEVEGVDFRGAMDILAKKAGVDLSAYSSKGAQEIARRKRRLLEAHELATQYYQQSLVRNQHAVDYVFKKRGLSKEIVQNFRIGYAPSNGDALVSFLTKKGFTKQELSQAGLTNRFGGDLFRGRMTVPLMDSSGQVIGFTARIITDEPNAPKYLNTPQTLLYDKGRHVFGLSQAKEAIRQNDYAVIVEGNLDVVSSHQAGVRQVVATAGTAMTEHHLKALVRLSPHARLAFDGDAAGLAATERAIPIAQAVGNELTIITLPEQYKDPDEVIQADTSLWQKAIDDAQPVVDWVLRQYSMREDLTTAAGKRRFTTAGVTVVRALQDPVEQEHYLQKIATYTGASLDVLKDKLAGVIEDEPKPLKKAVHQTTPVAPDGSSYQDSLLAVTLIDPAVRELLKEVEPSMVQSDERQALLAYLKGSTDVVTDTPPQLQSIDTYVKIVLLKADARYGTWSDEDRYFEAARLIRQLTTEHKQKQKQLLTEALRRAEEDGDDETARHMRQQLNDLIKEIPRAKK
ncbi:DNA primase [Candidatus Saccharibacteria bacterium]|nr:DNA primase [Candidatus Saccharibacteria bacterium]MBJ58311.1 DNA primase [Candidatus Saccharibacteria bacterium]MBQ69522.1 DNA primase [Candidatus Saccharibacteria bacterium]|tara:strand:- start:863 stop:2611 length:1749 start_codon:yes stop_codon:yes gene_type:complete